MIIKFCGDTYLFGSRTKLLKVFFFPETGVQNFSQSNVCGVIFEYLLTPLLKK
jgi:hypothetical protein